MIGATYDLSLARQLSGELVQVQYAEFNYSDTLQNYLRRGYEPLFEPSPPA